MTVLGPRALPPPLGCSHSALEFCSEHKSSLAIKQSDRMLSWGSEVYGLCPERSGVCPNKQILSLKCAPGLETKRGKSLVNGPLFLSLKQTYPNKGNFHSGSFLFMCPLTFQFSFRWIIFVSQVSSKVMR